MSDTEDTAKVAEKARAVEESRQETVSKPGGFKNDPDEPTNPNEEIERTRRKLRPTQ
jgi:hypothetical protein